MDRDYEEFLQLREHYEHVAIRPRQRVTRVRNPSVFKRRLDPLTALSDLEFKQNYRYSYLFFCYYVLFVVV